MSVDGAHSGCERSHIQLPAAPPDQSSLPVGAWSEPVSIDTYIPLEPDVLPAFLDRRVYQGASGKVFPLPFHERISATKQPHLWHAVHLENEWIRLMILPELGGRIHIGYDKVAAYDFFYRNNVIKPALVGLAGPWISGGVEFNWPQHHRPATFLPTDVEIERENDGSVTVWCSDHDPFTRMKGMHGIRLRPDSSIVEARVRLFNRTDERQTFLWWANVAARVGDDYQSFFPPDVEYVADHAKRAVVDFPVPHGRYYGVDYSARGTSKRPDGDRLDWYRNIPVPTSYMVLDTDGEFFGGYDHRRDAGFVHWADRDVSPGKKQWTWGNAPSGWAWDGNLTDDDGPYVELMAGVFTDNQPDFAYLAPGETKTFSQFWYPISGTGPVQQVTRDAAIRIVAREGGIDLYVSSTRTFGGTRVQARDAAGSIVFETTVDLQPATTVVVPVDGAIEGLVMTLTHDGRELVASWRQPSRVRPLPLAATEPPPPPEISSVEELYLVGSYLRQNHHATRLPEPYWEEALRRDAGDARSHIALAESAIRAWDFRSAETHLRAAIARVTAHVPTPATGEAHYLLGVVLGRRGRDAEADELLARAAWDAAWRVPAWLAQARISSRSRDYPEAERLLRAIRRVDPDQLQAAALLATVLRAMGRTDESTAIVDQQSALDRLDQWTRDLAGLPLSQDAPMLLDVALEYRDAGFLDDALRLLDAADAASRHTALGQVQVAPLVAYHRAWILRNAGEHDVAVAAANSARDADARWAAASRWQDVQVLLDALRHRPDDALASLLLGNWFYDRRRPDDAIRAWHVAAEGDLPAELTAIAERNLGIAAYNVRHDAREARRHYDRALEEEPRSAKLVYESDQLDARMGVPWADRLARLGSLRELVAERDDLTVTYVELLTRAGRATEAHGILLARTFQPWEGGEGQTLAAWENAMLSLSEEVSRSDPEGAVALARAAMESPPNLGEARHALANTAQLRLAVGDALNAAGHAAAAQDEWAAAAASVGDFTGMRPREFSDKTYFSILALRRLGRDSEAESLMEQWRADVDRIAATAAEIDFFATSLPTMLLFADDPQVEQDGEVARTYALIDRLSEERAGRSSDAGLTATVNP